MAQRNNKHAGEERQVSRTLTLFKPSSLNSSLTEIQQHRVLVGARPVSPNARLEIICY